MALKIPAWRTERITLVQQQAAEVLHLLETRADDLRLSDAHDPATERCREIVAGADVEFRDEYTVGVLLNNVHHRLGAGLD